jgi:hypothetical protein
MKKLFIYLLIFAFACNSKNDIKEDCPSLDLSQNRKNENNLFLDFYHGMNEKEYYEVVDNLIDKGILSKDPIDSDIKFRVDLPPVPYEEVTESNSHINFSLSPKFSGCKLYEITLYYTCYFSPDGSKIENDICPDESKTRRVELMYADKYGKHIDSTKQYFPLEVKDTKIWKVQNNKIEIFKFHHNIYHGNVLAYNDLNAFFIIYTNMIEENKQSYANDSLTYDNYNKQNKKASKSIENL